MRGRDLGGTVEEAIDKLNKLVPLPRGIHYVWVGEYESKQRADKRLALIVPLTVLLIAIILYMMFKSFKWAGLILINVALARVGGMVALLFTHTNISVSSSVGMLALFGVSVQTGVIMLEYINQLRAAGHTVEEAAIEGAVLRLRPIMMTMLVATLGLLPAALSSVGLTELAHGIYRAQTPAMRLRRQSFVDALLQVLTVYPYTKATALLAAKIDGEQQAQGVTIPFPDLLIGVTALELGFSVLTVNLRHFRLIPGLRIEQL